MLRPETQLPLRIDRHPAAGLGEPDDEFGGDGPGIVVNNADEAIPRPIGVQRGPGRLGQGHHAIVGIEVVGAEPLGPAHASRRFATTAQARTAWTTSPAAPTVLSTIRRDVFPSRPSGMSSCPNRPARDDQAQQADQRHPVDHVAGDRANDAVDRDGQGHQPGQREQGQRASKARPWRRAANQETASKSVWTLLTRMASHGYRAAPATPAAPARQNSGNSASFPSVARRAGGARRSVRSGRCRRRAADRARRQSA